MMNSTNMRRVGFFAIACIAISQMVTGCIGSSPATRYYAFSSDDFINDNDGDLRISVGPFEIPDYLNRPQIVIRDQGTQLMVLKSDRWAEPLNEAIARHINRDLNNQFSAGLFYQFPSVTDVSPDYKIRGRIYNFEANTDGTVVLRVQWVVLDREGNFVVEPQGETFSTTVSSTDDIAAVTGAMDSLLSEFALKIAAELGQAGIK